MRNLKIGAATLVLAGVASAASAVNLVANGGFELGLLGWAVADQAGSSGSWFSQTGTGSPINALAVPAPPEGLLAAMTDQGGPGSHMLYQDIVVPGTVVSATLSYQKFIGNYATDFFSPDTLDSMTVPNQQVRVDLIDVAADPFSVAVADILQNSYQSMPGDPLYDGYVLVTTDVTATLQAYLGQTIRLRFAEADNQLFLNFGVDDVKLDVDVVPEPASMLALLGGVAAMARRRRKA